MRANKWRKGAAIIALLYGELTYIVAPHFTGDAVIAKGCRSSHTQKLAPALPTDLITCGKVMTLISVR